MQASSFYQLLALNAKFMSLYSFFYRNVFLLTILKGLKPFCETYKWKRETELRNFQHLNFTETKTKLSALPETHINHDQIHHIRNNCLGSHFFSWNSHTKGCSSCFIWDLNVDTDPKGRFVSFKFTPSNDRVLCVYATQGIAPGNS